MPTIHVKFYSLERYSEEANFKSFCPTCNNGILLMGRDFVTGELLPSDCCVQCGQVVIYDDIEEVRKKGGWR
jgi:hypothetical protein